MEYIALGLTRDKALKVCGLTKHQYYQLIKSGSRRGAKPSTVTNRIDSGNVEEEPNEQVVEYIKDNHTDPDLRYGYQRMTKALQIQGYIINHKKVYRLMKEHQLLQERRKTDGKQYAKYRIVIPVGPLEVLEMDIKYKWIEMERRHAYILTILDCFTRMALNYHVGMSITQYTIRDVWNELIINHLQPNDMLSKAIQIEVRNDNDKRFSAKMVQKFFSKNHLNQVFIHPYTPQENGHIESFHAILSKSLDRFHFDTLEQLETHLAILYEKYNNTRLHGSIAKLSPRTFWEQWEKGNIARIESPHKKVKFKLLIPYHEISGNGNLREASCLKAATLDGLLNSQKQSERRRVAITTIGTKVTVGRILLNAKL